MYILYCVLGVLLVLTIFHIPEGESTFFWSNDNDKDFRYHSNKEIFKILRKKYRFFKTEVMHLGHSVKGAPIEALEIYPTDYVSGSGIPIVKLIGNIHGNEAVGREVILSFINYLQDNYKSDPDVECLVDNVQFSMIPTMNPDGFNMSTVGDCDGLEGRNNAEGVDLNRDFPGIFDRDYGDEMQPETKAISTYTLMHNPPFVLSASLHGGALVANYPYDTIWMDVPSTNGESVTPDDEVFVHLAKTYSKEHGIMWQGNNCGNQFVNGITNGYKWYDVEGSMQDYNYLYTGCMELSLEISCCKYPPEKYLEYLVKQNMKPLVKLSLQALRGVRGYVLDWDTQRGVIAALKVQGRDVEFRTSQEGEFWRILLPGTYVLQVRTLEHLPTTQEITVESYPEDACPITEFVIIWVKNKRWY